MCFDKNVEKLGQAFCEKFFSYTFDSVKGVALKANDITINGINPDCENDPKSTKDCAWTK
jgi:hypothetical protein